MIAFETLHCMKSHNSGPFGFMALKLNMSKASNKAEWNFLENIMQKMGFNERWIGLVMVCVKYVMYSILVNGEPKGTIQPSRGIQQGTPFPHSFFCCALKGYMASLTMQQIPGMLRASPCVEEVRPKLTHLLFANDSLLFCRATIDECDKVLNILETYAIASGEKVNKNKTTLFFSKSTSEPICQAIKEKLSLQEISQYEKFLGLPSLVGKRKKESFNYIKERVWTKLQG